MRILLGYILLVAACESIFPWTGVVRGTALWHPAEGLHFALAVLVGPLRATPLIAGATLLNGLFAEVNAGAALTAAVLAGGGHAAAGAWLRPRMKRQHPAAPRSVAQSVVVALLVGLTVGGGTGLVVRVLETGSIGSFALLLKGGLASAVGIGAVAPSALQLLLVKVYPWMQSVTPDRLLGVSLPRRKQILLAGQVAAVIGSLLLARYVLPSGAGYYVCFLPVLWMAYHSRLSRASLGVLMTVLGLVLIRPPDAALLPLQELALLIFLTGSLMGALTSERKRSFRALQREQSAAGAAPVPDDASMDDPHLQETAQRLRRTEPDTIQYHVEEILLARESLAQDRHELVVEKEELESRNRRKDEFLANLTHEFRTPLTLILGPIRQLLDGQHEALPQPVREQLHLMKRNAVRLKRLTEQILDLARLDAGRLSLEQRRADLAALVRETARSFTPLAERQDVTLTVHAGDPLQASFDPLQLEKVVGNLISNALKFTPEGGRVAVRLESAPTKKEARILVEDTGIGLSEEEKEHVFDRFYQVDGSATRRQEGMGIGLALCSELVEQHGGSLRVESEQGRGSTFSVHLPNENEENRSEKTNGSAKKKERPGAEDDHLAPVETRVTASETVEVTSDAPPPSVDDPGVLVIDDHADLRTYVRAILTPGYRVLEAADGKEGLQTARRELPDCIVADVMMPGLDGFELSRRLKDDAMTAGIPLLMLTARADVDDEVEGLLHGADDYLRKPFEAEVLRARIGALLDQRRRLREQLTPDDGNSCDISEAPSFAQAVHDCVRAHLQDPAFDVQALADELGLGRRQLTRRLNEKAGTTPARLIRRRRLQRAAQLLKEDGGTVTEVAYAVGFESLSHFSTSFKEHFGAPPSRHAASA
jgi:signal transduction histidine kinase/DNA-binding response OmpR family regulator